MKAVFIIAMEQFRDEEFLEPKQILEDNGIKVTVASWNTGVATGSFGLKANVDITISDIIIADYDAIVFIGGIGCRKYWDDPCAHKIAVETVEQRKILAAICSAPVTLARAKVLSAKNATCFSGDAEELKKEGARYTGAPLEQDGLIITADGPKSAALFGTAIAGMLSR